METTVVKIGGALITDPGALSSLWDGVRSFTESRCVVVVHGGGPLATQVARRLGHEPRMVHGRRVTSDLDLKVVQWTMRGELNSQLVAAAAKRGVRAVGISGADGGVLRVTKRPPWNVDGEQVDFGWVGDVEHVEPKLLRVLLDGGFVPVVAPLGIDAEGRLYNVNADTVSSAVAAALQASEYFLVTESGGVFEQIDDPHSLLARCTAEQFRRGEAEGWIQGGMRVKLKVAFDALNAGIRSVHIVPPEGIVNRELGTQVIA